VLLKTGVFRIYLHAAKRKNDSILTHFQHCCNNECHVSQ